MTVPILVPSPTAARGSRGRSDRDSGGAQKKAKKKEREPHKAKNSGGEIPTSEAGRSDRAAEQDAISVEGESVADNVNERPLEEEKKEEEEGRMRRGVRRVLSSVSGMEFAAVPFSRNLKCYQVRAGERE